MASVEKWVPAQPADVWAILADPRGYAFWVVGSHDIVAADNEWPAVGATFKHVQGQGPLKISDTTTVLEVDPPRRLVLEVRVRPILTAIVELGIKPSKGGTCITIDERVNGGALRVVPRFVTSPLIALRNADALRRLAAMAWVHAEGGQPAAAPREAKAPSR